MGTYQPRRAVVTGAESGIGRAIAVALADLGCDIGIVWNRDEAMAQETARLAQEHGRVAALRQADLSQLPHAADVLDELADELGGIDVLVNDAGTGTSTPFLELTYDDWRHVVAVDLDAAFLLSQRAAKRMVEQGDGGRIISISSVHEVAPRVGSAPYDAAKGGLGLLTKTMAIELGAHGITCNTVGPGEIATAMTGQEDEDPRGNERPGIPLGRPGDANEVAAVVAFLASPQSAYVTGATWLVDGGMTLMGPMAGSHMDSHAWREG